MELAESATAVVMPPIKEETAFKPQSAAQDALNVT